MGFFNLITEKDRPLLINLDLTVIAYPRPDGIEISTTDDQKVATLPYADLVNSVLFECDHGILDHSEVLEIAEEIEKVSAVLREYVAKEMKAQNDE